MRDPYVRNCRLALDVVTSRDRIVDGDTVYVDVDLGFELSARLDLRLDGLDAPKGSTESGKASTAYQRAWWAEHAAHAHGEAFPFTLTTTKTEKYGRWLASVACRIGHVLNADMLAAGVASAWDGRGPHPATAATHE